MITNEFGKISADQLLTVLAFQPLMSDLGDQIHTVLAESVFEVAKLSPKGFRWSGVYEIGFEEHLARIVMLMGKASVVVSAAQSLDPAAVLIADLNQQPDDTDEDLNTSLVGEPHSFTYFVGLYIAVIRTFEAVAIYGRYIHELVEEARGDGPNRDIALFNAIRIDPSVVSGPTAARHIATAVAMNDQGFIVGLQLALQGKTGDQAAYLRKFRLAIKILFESNALAGSATALAKRLVELEIYPKGPTALKNATELVRKAQKIHAI